MFKTGFFLIVPQLKPAIRFLSAVALVSLATGISALFHGHIAGANLAMIYLMAVMFSAAYLGRGPAILASFLGVLALDYFYVPPYLTLRVFDAEYLITFAGLLCVSLVLSELTARVRQQAENARQRELETAALYALSCDLVVAESPGQIAGALNKHIHQAFEQDIHLFLPDLHKDILSIGADGQLFTVTQDERSAVRRVLDSREPWFNARDEILYLPLRASQGVVGVLSIQTPGDPMTEAQRRLVEAFANQAAQVIAHLQLAEHAKQVQVMQQAERLQTALLNSISHDLRTPLVSITGALSTLLEKGLAMDQELYTALVENAYQEANHMNRLVSNLLNMTRLEAGAVKVARQAEDVQDVIGSTLEQMNERLGSRLVQVHVAANVPMISIDFVLIVQVLTNILDNAIKYSPAETPIEIDARVSGEYVEISIADRGVGIPAEDLGRVFDKFYRVRRPENVKGIGLGLPICKGIIEAHGGAIQAEQRPQGGTVLRICLPTCAAARFAPGDPSVSRDGNNRESGG